jgi:hypothetical protein
MALVSHGVPSERSPEERVLKEASKLTISEMKAQVAQLQPPLANRMEEVYRKYLTELKEMGVSRVQVEEPDINWRALVLAQPKPLPAQILGCGFRKVWLQEYECVYEGCYRFHLERLDGTLAAFNWKQSYRDMYHRYFAKGFRNDVEMALRAAILPHLVQYKENQRDLVSDWSGVALSWENAAVQHFPISFSELVASFLDHMQIKLERIALDYDPYHVFVLKNKELEKEWVNFHALRAYYRILSVDEAMREGDL